MPEATEIYEQRPEVFLPTFGEWAEDAGDQVTAMVSLVESEYDHDPSTVLDVGCGAGRHAIEFAERGIEAHGIDLSEVYIQRARERASEAGVDAATSFSVRDMRNLDGIATTYDLLTCVYTSFGFFDDATNASVIESFAERLRPGGVAILEVSNKEGYLSSWTGASVSRPRQNAVHAEEFEYDPRSSRVTVTIFAVEDGTYLGEGSFEIRFYTPIELEQLFLEAGFTDVRLFDGFDGAALSRESQRVLVMGRK